MKRTFLKFFSVVVVIAIVAYFIYSQFTLSFGALGCVLALLAVAAVIGGLLNMDNSAYTARSQAYLYAFSLMVFGFLSIYTINNYLSPRSEIFTNADHHVIRIEGLEINMPGGFLLVSDSNKALFDNDATVGEARIKNVSDSAVTIELKNGFMRPVYSEHYNTKDQLITQTLLNKTDLVTFNRDSRLYLKTKRGKIYTFEAKNDTRCNPKKDTMRYYLNGIESDNHTFLLKGTDLSSLLSGLRIDSLNIDVDGIHLVRTKVYTQTKQKERRKFYPDDEFAVVVRKRNGALADNSIVEISNDGRSWTKIGRSQNSSITIRKDTYCSIGYGTEKTVSFKFSDEDGKLALRYRMPMMRYFTSSYDRPDNLILLTHSLNLARNGVDETYGMLPDNIMLFDIFNHIDNVNRIKPKQLSYISGPTSERFYVDSYDYTSSSSEPKRITSGDRLEGTTAIGTGNVNWIVKLHDFKDSSFYNPFLLKITVLILTLALSVLLLVGSVGVYKYRKDKLPLYSSAEFVAYMVTVYLVTLRLFLLWRVSVFPPVANVSCYEFGLFQEWSRFSDLILVLAAFVICVLSVKIFLIKCKSIRKINLDLTGWYDNGPYGEKSREQILILLGLGLSLYAVAGVFGWLTGKSLVKILSPVVVYFMMLVCIHWKYSRPYNSRGKDNALLVFILDVANALSCGIILYVFDSGYGILFITFSIVWMLIELYDILRNSERGILWKPYKFAIVIVLFLLFGLFVLFYKDILAALLSGKYWYMFGMVAAVLTVAIAIAWFGFKMEIGKWKGTLIAAIAVFIVFSSGSVVFKYVIEKYSPHTVQRINVHVKTPDEALEDIVDNANQARYRQAALNHMVIGEYNDRGSNVKLFGEKGAGYFKMQPHSKIGAMWGAQLSDIALVRFVIAEHSKLLGPLLVFMFVLMFCAGAFVRKHHRFARYILLEIPLLLMIQSLLIWMANTQRFVFLGQDFPMVSINSRLSIVFYMTLLLIWIVVLLYEKRTEFRINKASLDFLRLESNTEALCSTMFFAVPLVLLATFVVKPNVKFKTFDVSEAMRRVVKDIENDRGLESVVFEDGSNDDASSVSCLNDALIAYQTGKSATKLRSMSNSDLARFISDFDREEDGGQYFSTNLGLNLWYNFVNHGAAHNSSKNVMYARLNKGGKVVISVDVSNFNRSLPSGSNDSWRGSVVAHSEERSSKQKVYSTAGATVYLLPGEWMRSGRETPLVTGRARVEGKGQILPLKPGTANAAAQLLPDMVVGGVGKIVPGTRFIARNVNVNGYPDFVYPLGEKLFWARNIANEIRVRKSRREDKGTPDFNYDVHLSLSTDLTAAIYDRFKNYSKGISDKAVVVADGEGRIVVMVDYKRRFRLNPNDSKKIDRIKDSLNMIGRSGGNIERNYFGNANLMGMAHGPGSTQKPLVWTAVASGIDLNWNKLAVAPFESYLESDSGHYIIKEFNGYPFIDKHPFRPLASDENHGSGFDLYGYMRHSSNLYNALMVYLGSWPADEYSPEFVKVSDDVDGSSLFAKAAAYKKDKKTYIDDFPILTMNGRNIRLNAHPCGNGDSWLENSLLQQNLKDMFGILPDGKNLLGTSFVKNLGGNSVGGYSYAEPSVLLCPDRSKLSLPERENNANRYFMEDAIRMTAIGARKVWCITPLKMAESFGKMASLNRDYNLTVMDDVEPEYNRFEGLGTEYLKARPKQFAGMNAVFSGNGTAARGMPQFSSGRIGDYYIYAKTGTIGEGDKNNAHRLAVIITDRDLTETDAGDLDDLRYYVMYFTFSAKGGWADYAEVIDMVVKSPEFINYMIYD